MPTQIESIDAIDHERKWQTSAKDPKHMSNCAAAFYKSKESKNYIFI